MRKAVTRVGMRVVSCFLAMMFMVTPAFAIVREVEVYGVRSVNDLGNSDKRVTMDDLKDAYSDFVQTDTLREYFHQDKTEPSKVDLDAALSWLIDNNIISRDQTVTVSNVRPNQIPQVDIKKFDTNELKGMQVYRTDMLMYVYKAAFGPIDARVIGVETDNVRVDDGVYITLKDLMEKNGYTTNPNYVLPGSGSVTSSGSAGGSGSGNGGAGSGGSGSNSQTNYINDFGNWRYQPQGNLWESIFGDTNIFISQNNFQQGNISGNGGNGGGGGAGIGGGGTGGGGNGGNSGNQTQVNTGNVGSIQGSDNNQTTTGSNNISGSGNPVAGEGSTSGSSGSGSAGPGSSGTGGSGGPGGQGGDGGENIINYETDYKQIYFIPGADLLLYHTSDVPEVYIQAALSKGILDFDSSFRTDKFKEEFVDWREKNKDTLQSWDGGSPAYIVNRTRNKLKTVSKTEQVPTQQILGTGWNVHWQSSTLTISRNTPFMLSSGYFDTDIVSKMDVYEYIYNFIRNSEKVLSELESDIVNYKYGMELDGITDEADTTVIKYLIAKGIINYEVTNEFMSLDAPISWSEFITLLYRVANKEARLDFSKIQLTDSETQWKARGYSPQTTYLVPGDSRNSIEVSTIAEYAKRDYGTATSEVLGTEGTGIDSILQDVAGDGRRYVRFGAPDEDQYIFHDTTLGDVFFYNLTSKLEGAMHNHLSNNGATYNCPVSAKDFLGSDVAEPQTNLGKYTLSLLYELACCSEKQLKATWNHDYDATNPKIKLMADVCCNIWAIANMYSYSQDLNEVSALLKAAMRSEDKMTDTMKDTINKHSKKPGEFITAATEVRTIFYSNVQNDKTKVDITKFQFGTNFRETQNWVQLTSGKLETLVNQFVAFEVYPQIDEKPVRFVAQATVPLSDGAVRCGGTEITPLEAGNALNITVVDYVVNTNLTEAEQEQQVRLNYSNNVSSFAALESLAATTPLQTFVDPETKDNFVSWSTIEKYKQTPTTSDRSLHIKKISDYLLYNEDTNTYAYFCDEKDKQMAIVGTDVVKASSSYGVIFREGSEVYYSIDAIRLLMDARQEAEVLGGLRTMPMASMTIQNNLTEVTIDNNDGVPTSSLTGISVMISDKDSVTRTKVTNLDSVYYSDTNVYFDVRWSNYLAISQANRAINAISRQFSYNGKSGAKLSAYAVVIFEPQSAKDMGSTSVDATSSLQDLLDSPMQKPGNPEGLQKWEQNKARCNLLANWVYGTSGREYISTGYLVPHAYVFSSDPDIASCMSDAEWTPLNNQPNADIGTGTERELVTFVRLYEVINGAVKKFGSSNTGWTADKARNDPEHRASYMLSEDYRVCVMGNRVYLNLGCFSNMSRVYGAKLRASNISLGSSAFTVGGTFRSVASPYQGASLDGNLAPKILVTKTETDGTVYCQVGPIYGLPIVYDNVTPAVVHRYSEKSQTSKTFRDFGDWSSKDNNQVQWMFEYLFQPTGLTDSYEGIELLGIADSPVLSADSSRQFVFDGKTIKKMKGEGRTQVEQTQHCYRSCMNAASKVADLKTEMNKSGTYSFIATLSENNVETYFNIKFNAFNYTIENGILKYMPNQATDFISPSLFTSLNDLIINGIINADNGAIPVEQIPFGSILQIGTGWYAAHGTSEDDIAFAGYAPLQIIDTAMECATIQDASTSFATQFVRAGNQQLNVSHFFNTAEVLAGIVDYEKTLKIVAESKLSEDKSVNKKYILGAKNSDGSANIGTIVSGDSTATTTYYYAPTNITFQKGILKAYCTSADGEEPARYTLVSSADSSVSGPLDELPFFSNNALSGTVSDRTTKAASGGFQLFYGSDQIMDGLRADFQKAFAGDLFTLARMLVFIVLVWLVVASWMCYGIYFGRLMPILDAIKHPTGDRAGKGIDLMKLISLGSISMETDFKLGRFLQYNCVLAALICAVYVSGRIF